MKLSGASTALAVAALYSPQLAGKVSSESSQDAETSTTKRLRRWCMVINLRRCDGCIGLNLPPHLLKLMTMLEMSGERNSTIIPIPFDILGAFHGLREAKSTGLQEEG